MSDLEQLLSQRLATVVEPPARLAPAFADALRQRHRRRRRLMATGMTVCGLAGVFGFLQVVGLLPAGGSISLQQQTGDAPKPRNTPVPGISPAFTPASGRDWLPSPAQFLAFRKAHPITGLGPEPAGTTADRLLQEVQQSGLPAGAKVFINPPTDDLPSVTVRLADGTPIFVERFLKLYPTSVNPDGAVRGSTYEVVDVPGTNDAALLRSRTGYQWPKGTVGDSDTNHDGDTNDSPSVITATSRGLCTFWVAPASVSLPSLRRLAVSADQWAAANPEPPLANR